MVAMNVLYVGATRAACIARARHKAFWERATVITALAVMLLLLLVMIVRHRPTSFLRWGFSLRGDSFIAAAAAAAAATTAEAQLEQPPAERRQRRHR